MTQESAPLNLDPYLEACRSKYAACLDTMETSIQIEEFKVELNFQHARFDGNGEPKFVDLAKCLADHVIEYCFSLKRRGNATSPHEFSRLNREARSLLRGSATSGESGEMLLYFLLESLHFAPQVVAKMDLKPNPRMELHGSDGIHMKWNEVDNVLDVFFGESKLEKSLSSALKNAFRSMEGFHKNGLDEHEIGLVTSHFKFMDDLGKDAVCRFIDRQNPEGECRINHACLIGYDWGKYKRLLGENRQNFIQNFKSHYNDDTQRLAKLLRSKLHGFSKPHLRIIMFFLPFKKVQEFRDAFNTAVGQ